MTAHKHTAMIKAKADNMDLVVFVKNSNTGDWFEVFGDLPFNQQQEFFMCLPQHKEAVLNVLNGGESQVNYGECWSEVNCNIPVRWGKSWWYMSDGCESRIKPRKEKRWVLIKPDGSVHRDLFHQPVTMFEGGKSYEIEVEV